MSLDQLAVHIDAHQRSIAADIHAAADPARGTDTAPDQADVVIGCTWHCAQLGVSKRSAWSGISWDFSSASKTSGALVELFRGCGGHDFATPDQSATRYVVEINKSLPFKEALPYIGHTVFNHRLILGMAGRAGSGRKPR